MKWAYTYFDLDEKQIRCSCCDCLKITPRLFEHMRLLSLVRREFALPIRITSGYRCENHNYAVGGVTDSQHRLFATDVQPTDLRYLDRLRAIVDEDYASAWDGIGHYPNFIHLDLRGHRARWDER